MADSKKVRQAAFRATVVFRLGAGSGARVRWNPRTQIPTLASDGPIRALAARLGIATEGWFYSDSRMTALEECEGRWRPVVQRLAFPPHQLEVPSVEESVAAFNTHVLPLERARGTRRKYATHRLSVLTWAVWKGVLHELLPMSEDLLRAYIWDSLAFEATLPVLKHCVNAIKAWHTKLRLPAPASGPGDYRRLTHSLARFHGEPRRLVFPIHAEAVRRLLLLPLPEHDAGCGGVRAQCPICLRFLHRWRDCLAGATGTVTCARSAETSGLQSCDLLVDFDARAGYTRFKGGAAVNVKVRKNDQFRHGHQARVGVARNPKLDLIRQLRAFMRWAGNGPRPGCTKWKQTHLPCPVCPPLFPRSVKGGTAFDLTRHPTSEEVSAMVVRGLGHVGYDTSLFSGISARRGGLSTAIEAGVPEHILWMQSGHAQDLAARRYVQLGSPALLYRTWEAFNL